MTQARRPLATIAVAAPEVRNRAGGVSIYGYGLDPVPPDPRRRRPRGREQAKHGGRQWELKHRKKGLQESNQRTGSKQTGLYDRRNATDRSVQSQAEMTTSQQPPGRSAPPTRARRTPAAARILETAERLFYTRGIGRVGVDTIVAESGVAKATLYAHFRSKDDLVAACLADRSQRQRERLEPLLSGDAPPGDRVRAAFARRAAVLTSPEWCGCAFINAGAEYPEPGGIVRDEVKKHRAWIRGFFRELAIQAGDPDPEDAAARLAMIWDAAAVTATFDDPETVAARTAALASSVLREGK